MLTVLVIAAVGSALLVTGLVSARSGSRLRQCSSNLRQLGVGLQSYHQANGMLPPAAIRRPLTDRVELTSRTSNGTPYSLPTIYANWAILLLDHVDRPDVSAKFDTSSPITSPANKNVRETWLPLMNCPSDTYNRQDNRHRLVPIDDAPSEFARGNYAINAGVSGLGYAPGMPWDPAPNAMNRDYLGDWEDLVERVWGNGVAGFNRSFSIGDFENGLAHLVGIEEVRAGMIPEDSRGAWAVGHFGSSVTFGHGLAGDDRGPNCPHERSDDVIGCNQAHEAFTCEGLVRKGMPCCSYASPGQATARSTHEGGVHVLMMDGSARFITDDIDLSVWHAMHSRESRDSAAMSEYVPTGRAAPSGELQAELRGKSAKAADPTVVPSSDIITNSVGMSLVRVPAGQFTMGLPDAGTNVNDPISGLPPETPPHRVRITQDFYMGAHEVTQQQYEEVVGTNPSAHTPEGQRKKDVVGKDHKQFPVEQVSWEDAFAFCRQLTERPEEKTAGRRYRLPTEAEWEYCCRSGSEQPFVVPSLSDAPETGYNVWPKTPEGLPLTEVGSYPANEFGLFDMRGNAWEWCSDWFAWDYYTKSPEADPQGPETGALRVVRGADWRFTGMGCHYPRYHTESWRVNPFIGFRVVCEIPGN